MTTLDCDCPPTDRLALLLGCVDRTRVRSAPELLRAYAIHSRLSRVCRDLGPLVLAIWLWQPEPRIEILYLPM